MLDLPRALKYDIPQGKIRYISLPDMYSYSSKFSLAKNYLKMLRLCTQPILCTQSLKKPLKQNNYESGMHEAIIATTELLIIKNL